jgi:hypothetical protein
LLALPPYYQTIPGLANLTKLISDHYTSPHDVLTQRMKAASRSLYRSEQRRSSAVTELAMMRSSGMVVGGAGVFMAGYLALVQWQRFTLAYSTVLGWIVGAVVLGALLLPLVGGFLLARTDDVDY